MAMVRDPTPTLCYDEAAFIDGVIHTGVEHENLLHHAWELPMAGSSPGRSRSCTFAQDGGWANMAGVVSSSSPVSSSSVVTFDGHGGEEQYCAAWTDGGLDQLIGYDLALAVAAPGHAAAASTVASNSFSFGGDSGGRDVTAAAASQKRPRARAPSREEAAPPAPNPKKQCGGNRGAAAKPTKLAPPTAAAPKEPQNLAAKNRRERITERLRALQELVPNGSKVDTVTMLDKAITYVKFMQLQLKVLQTDAFWPAPGGEAPGMSQVKDALDAILLSPPFSSQR